MDPNLVSVLIAAVGIIVSGVSAYHAARRGTEIALVRQEERHKALAERCEEDRVFAQRAKSAHDTRLGAHELSIGLLNQRVFGNQQPPTQGPPRDFAPG